jgi:hypothetical protein
MYAGPRYETLIVHRTHTYVRTELNNIIISRAGGAIQFIFTGYRLLSLAPSTGCIFTFYQLISRVPFFGAQPLV